MALTHTPFLSLTASRTLNGITAQHFSHGTLLRPYTPSRVPGTTAQTTHQTYLPLCLSVWRTASTISYCDDAWSRYRRYRDACPTNRLSFIRLCLRQLLYDYNKAVVVTQAYSEASHRIRLYCRRIKDNTANGPGSTCYYYIGDSPTQLTQRGAFLFIAAGTVLLIPIFTAGQVKYVHLRRNDRPISPIFRVTII